MSTKIKIILRAYPKVFEWEPLDAYEARINEFVESHDVVEVAPINMDGVMIRYKPIEVIVTEWSRHIEPPKCVYDDNLHEWMKYTKCSKCGAVKNINIGHSD